MSAVQFQEVQTPRSVLFWVIFLLLPLTMSIVLVYQLITGHPVGNRPLSNTALMILIPSITIATVLLLRQVRFTIIITDDRIKYGFNIPTPDLNEIKIPDIKECYLVEKRVPHFGYHLSVKNGVMFNLSGRKNIQIIKKNGDKIMLGTNKSEELLKIFAGADRSSTR